MSPSPPPRKRFGDILVDAGLITPTQVKEALDYGKEHDIKLGQSLRDLGFVDDLSIAQSIAKQLSLPFIDFDKVVIDPKIVALVPEIIARKHKLIALGKRQEELLVAFADPLNIFAIDEVTKAVAGKIVPCVAAESRIVEAIDKSYHSKQEITEKTEGTGGADDSQAVDLVNNIILQAVNEGSSDIHIEPAGKNVRIRFRVDGLLRVAKEIPIDLHPSIVSRLKIISQLDIGERRKPQDGRFEIPIGGKSYDVRVSTLPLNDGEKIVMRLLDKSKIKIDLQDLGFEPQHLQTFDAHLHSPHEIILVTGPTGSGKTTTLYGALNRINSVEKNIITVEDPVEYELLGVNQVQVNPKANLTFASALRSILRQDPDVVMIGEIRDVETAEIAIQAALTGHLVLSTLHTNDSTGAITRLIEMGIAPFLISSALGLVLAQRLLRLLCPHCKTEFSPSKALRSDLGLPEDPALKLFRPNGCERCGHIGQKGRLAIYEVLAMSREIELLIMGKASSHEIYRQALKEGLVSLRQAGIRKMLAGVTSPDEVMRVSMDNKEQGR